MKNEYYTVEQISQLLNIHPKTIQRYIREGKLRAIKIGKSWRVSGHDLSVFTESEGTMPSKANKSEYMEQRNAKASSVIDIDISGTEEAITISNSLTAAMNSKPIEYGQTSMHTQFLESEQILRITLWGNITFMAAIMNIMKELTERKLE